MATKTAQQALQKWQAQMASPSTSAAYVNGINSTTVNPMQLAAQNVQGYVQGVAASQQKWVSKLQAVPLQTWKNNATQVGAPRLASGAQKAGPKYLAFAQNFAPIWAQMKTAAKAAASGPKSPQRAQARFGAAIQLLMSAAQSNNVTMPYGASG
jgi:hypothetical protein